MLSALHIAAVSQVNAQPKELHVATQVMPAAHIHAAPLHAQPMPVQDVGPDDAAPQPQRSTASAATTKSRARSALNRTRERMRPSAVRFKPTDDGGALPSHPPIPLPQRPNKYYQFPIKINSYDVFGS
jgi:hypothetical protein